MRKKKLYDIDSYHRYLDLFEEGEPVYITEKLEGENGRFVYNDGQFYCGSRTRWKKERAGSQWWQALNNTPGFKERLIRYEGSIFYGEVYGRTGIFKYDAEGKSMFRAFDILHKGEYLNPDEFLDTCYYGNIPTVPVLEYDWPLDKSKVMEYAEGQSTIGNHVREGCVIKPMVERQHESIGRVFLKLVGNGYYSLK